MDTRIGKVGVWFAFALGAAACAGTPATPEQRRLAEQRLLEPFLRDTQVGCGQLLLELTGNFHSNVGQPAIDVQAHTAKKERGDGYVETVWTNKLGDPATAFVVTVGEPMQITERGVVQGPRMKFTVLHEVRLRVYEDSRPLTLNARAGGQFVLVQEAAGQKARELREFAVVDGAMRMP